MTHEPFWEMDSGILLPILTGFHRALHHAGSPKDAYGMVRYALPHMHRGTLKVGSGWPDAAGWWRSMERMFPHRERTGARRSPGLRQFTDRPSAAVATSFSL